MTLHSFAAAVAPFRNEGRGVRAHVAVRWLSCPFDRLLDETRPALHGRVLDYGCGHGLLTHRIAAGAGEGSEVLGVDIDAGKVATATRTAASGRPAFRVNGPGEIPDGPWDAIVVVDVLYLLAEPARTDLLRGLAGALGPGGTLVLKEMAAEPAPKAALMRVQERLAVNVMRLTKGEALAFTSAERLADQLAGLGLAVTTKRIDRGYPHPHHLVIARRA